MNSKGVQPIWQFLSPNAENFVYQNITLQMHKLNDKYWWEVVEDCNGTSYDEGLSKLPFAACPSQNILYIFNDKIYPSSLSPFISGGYV